MMLICHNNAADTAKFQRILDASGMAKMTAVGLMAMASMPEAVVIIDDSKPYVSLDITIEDAVHVHKHQHKLDDRTACAVVERLVLES